MPSLQDFNLQTLDLKTLEKMSFESEVFLFKQSNGGEDYTARYKNDPHFNELIEYTVKLKRKIVAHFKSLKDKIPMLVAVDKLSAADYSYGSNGLEDYWLYPYAWEKEQNDLGSVLYDFLLPIIIIGAMSLERELAYHSNIHDDNSPAIKEIRKTALKYSKGITDTTKGMILEQIKTSTSLAETRDQLVSRLNKLIDNEIRAELIAQTESVRAYSEGRHMIAEELGLEKKVWEATFGACPICLGLNNVEINATEAFPGGYPYPPAHPRCKCSIRYYTPFE